MRILIVSMLIGLVANREAAACKRPGPVPLTLDTAHLGETAPPSEPDVTFDVIRDKDPGGCLQATSCDPYAAIYFHAKAIDDTSPADAIGFVAELVDGTPPEGLRVPDEPTVDVRWVFDPTADDFTIDVAIYAIDSNGNRGPSTLVRVEDDHGGCSVGRRTPRPGSAILMVLVAGAILRPRTPRR